MQHRLRRIIYGKTRSLKVNDSILLCGIVMNVLQRIDSGNLPEYGKWKQEPAHFFYDHHIEQTVV